MAEPTRINVPITGDPPIGIDPSSGVEPKPVVSHAEELLWAVQRFGENEVTLRIGEYEVVSAAGRVVAVPDISAPPRPPFKWTRKRVNEHLPVETFHVIDPKTGLVWTLITERESELPVELRPLKEDDKAQWFKFNPLRE